MRIRLYLLLLVLGIVLTVSWVALAQGDCPVLVEQALTSVGDNCTGLERNAACYGYNLVTATFSQAQPIGYFSAPADRADLKVMQTIRTAPLNLSNQIWGVAVLNVQANVPNSLPGQAVTFILMGDGQLSNEVAPDQALTPVEPVDVLTQSASELHGEPNADSAALASIPSGTTLPADALSEDAGWVRVLFENQAGWVNRSALDPAARVSGLPVVTPESRSPMQAFYFTSGVGRPTCTEAPSVLAVRSPENLHVDLTVNGANIHIGSFVTFQTSEHNTLNMTVHQGRVEDDEGKVIEEGETSEGALDDEGNVTDWGDPRPASDDEQQAGNVALRFDQVVGSEGEQPPPTETPDQCAPTEHIVERGENLFRIALRYNTSMSSIVAANGITDPRLIFVGQRLVIPNPCSGFQGIPGGGQQPAAGGLVQGVDCSGFVLTSPPNGGPVVWGQQLFTWEAAPGADSYLFDVYTAEGAAAGSLWFEKATDGINLTVDTSLFGVGTSFLWDVAAVKNGAVVCRTVRQAFTRGPAPILSPVPQPAPTPSFTASWACSGFYQFTVSYSGIPAGDSVRITYTVSAGSPIPVSGTVFSVPPNSQTFTSTSPVTVLSGKVRKMSTGEIVNLSPSTIGPC